MPSDALVIAPVILAVVLLVSAWGKLRAPESSAEAFSAMRVPTLVSGRLMVRALPWVEVVLAVGLLVTSGVLGALAGVATVLLVSAYLWLVARARGFETDVDCACFGSLGPSRITGLTVARNVWLLALALVSLVAISGPSVVARVTDGRAPWWWLTAAAAAALTVVLVAGHTDPGPQRGRDAAEDLAFEEGDYIRMRTPALPIVLGDGSTTNLRRLSDQRPQLLLYVSEGCGSCQDVIAAVPEWRTQLPQVDVRLVVRSSVDTTSLTSSEEPRSIHDIEGLVAESLGLRATPSAILLGADGLLAGGPSVGSAGVPNFVADIRAELAGS